jgi:hypothetical protein
MGVLSNVSAVPGGKPFEPFGKDSICSEGGSTGRRTDWPCHINIAEKVKLLRPSVQLPAGIHGCAVYTDFQRDGKAKRMRAGSVLIESERKLYLFILTRFLHANRYPLRSKTL